MSENDRIHACCTKKCMNLLHYHRNNYMKKRKPSFLEMDVMTKVTSFWRIVNDDVGSITILMFLRGALKLRSIHTFEQNAQHFAKPPSFFAFCKSRSSPCTNYILQNAHKGSLDFHCF